MYTPIALFTIMGIASILGAIAIFTRLPNDHPHKNPQLGLRSRIFGIDLRSLAFFRVALGSMVISDILHRIPDMTAHYTDQGILPRADLISKFLGKWILSLHMWNGTEVGVTLIFGFTIFCGLCLLMGYRTKLFTFLCWLLIISLHGRNHMVLQAGDVLFRILLFWAMFLPTGARFSVDSALNSNADSDPPPRRILTIATLAILLQAGLVYVFSAAMKSHAHWWPRGEAVYLAISIDHFTTPVAHWLLNYPVTMKYLALYTWWLEWLGPFLLFVPIFTGHVRLLLVFLFWSLHIGFGSTLLIGMFVFVSISSWIPYIPALFWDRIGYAWEKRRSSAVQIFYDGGCNFCAKGVRLLKTFLILPKAELLTGQSREDIAKLMDEENSWVVVTPDGTRYLRSEAVTELVRRSPLFWPLALILGLSPIQALTGFMYRHVASNRARFSVLTRPFQMRPLKWKLSLIGKILATGFLIIVFIWNFANLKADKKYTPEPLLRAHKELVKYKRALKPYVYSIRIDQRWNMFAPYPLKSDGWFVIDGQLRDKSHVSLFTKRFMGKDLPVSFEKPTSQKFFEETGENFLVSEMYPRQRWRKYLMNLWSKKHKKHRLHFGRYMCRYWNRFKNAEQVDQLTEECFDKADATLWADAFIEGYSWSAYSEYKDASEQAEKKCRRSARSKMRKTQLTNFKMYYMKESSHLKYKKDVPGYSYMDDPDYKVLTKPVKKVEIWNHWCFKKPGEDGKVPDSKKKKPNKDSKTRAKSRS